MLPDTESDDDPVTSLKTFSSPRRHRNPRKANTRASLKQIVSLSVSSTWKVGVESLDLNKFIRVLLKAPPPVTSTLIGPLRLFLSSSDWLLRQAS